VRLLAAFAAGREEDGEVVQRRCQRARIGLRERVAFAGAGADGERAVSPIASAIIAIEKTLAAADGARAPTSTIVQSIPVAEALSGNLGEQARSASGRTGDREVTAKCLDAVSQPAQSFAG
jgi:hypothetical protein